MTFHLLFAQLLNGLGMGLAYSLVALGYNLTFGVLRIANLAYGDVLMVGAMLAVAGLRVFGIPPAFAILVGIGGATLVGLAVHIVAVMPLGRVEDVASPRHVAVLVSTIGASLVIQSSALELFGAYPQPFGLIVPDRLRVGSTSTLLINVSASVAILVGLAVLISRSAFGLRLRALTSDRDLGAASGVNVVADQLKCVALSSALAGVAGVLICEQVGAVSPFIGLPYGLKALVALIVGNSMVGTVAVAITLGISEGLVVGFVSSGYRDVLVYGVLIVFLATRAIGRPPHAIV